LLLCSISTQLLHNSFVKDNYILPSVISFFFIFFNDFLRSARPNFTIFSLNESVLGADDQSGPPFLISQGTLPWQPIKVEKLVFFTDQSTLLRCHSERDCNIAITISKD